MDWNKTKSIFILVFVVLNVFLYSQYVDTYTEGQRIEILSEQNIEAKLKEDNITYSNLPTSGEVIPYLSAKVKHYSLEELPFSTNFSYKLITETLLMATLKTPIKLTDPLQPAIITEFVHQYVHEGKSFILWEVDEETRTALFFQRENNQTLYFNKSGYVKVHWNANNEVFMYEQSILEKLEEIEQQEKFTQPLEVLQALYAKNLLKPKDHIKDMKLGYSTLVQLTETQLFAPTWEVNVETADKETARYFVNAVDGKVIEIDSDVDLQQVLEE